MGQSPRYAKIFEYLEENYGLQSPDTPITRFYKSQISDYQYIHLDGAVSSEKTEFEDTESAAGSIREFAQKAGADLVGFTEVKDSFVFQGARIEHGYSVVLAVEMDFDLISTAPESPSGIEVLKGYWRLGDVSVRVARFIRSLGYPARVHHPRGYVGYQPTILHTVAAIEAGLGELGRHGVLITEEFGPRVRVATITTELKLPPGKRRSFGVDEFCRSCHVCEKACQGEAIPRSKQVVRGFEKYTIDPYKCLPYFAKYDGCNICVARCVFNKRPQELKRFIDVLRSKKL